MFTLDRFVALHQALWEPAQRLSPRTEAEEEAAVAWDLYIETWGSLPRVWEVAFPPKGSELGLIFWALPELDQEFCIGRWMHTWSSDLRELAPASWPGRYFIHETANDMARIGATLLDPAFSLRGTSTFTWTESARVLKIGPLWKYAERIEAMTRFNEQLMRREGTTYTRFLRIQVFCECFGAFEVPEEVRALLFARRMSDLLSEFGSQRTIG